MWMPPIRLDAISEGQPSKNKTRPYALSPDERSQYTRKPHLSFMDEHALALP